MNIFQWKIIQGFPNSIYELDGKNNPLELGLSDLIDFDKGCFLGQETLSKIRNVGQVKCKLKFFISDTLIQPGEDLLNKINNEKGYEKVGIVTSAISKDNKFIGLALIRKKFLALEQIELPNNSGKLTLLNPIGFNNI